MPWLIRISPPSPSPTLLRRFLQFGLFFWQDCTLYRADLNADTAVDAGVKIDPVPVSTFLVFTGAFVNTGNRTSVYAVGNALADVGNNGVGHGN